MHINGIIKLSVEKEHDSNIKIYNEVPNVGGYSIITFKQPSLDEYKTILEPYGYKITYGITGHHSKIKMKIRCYLYLILVIIGIF
jgi:hypothetical protein